MFHKNPGKKRKQASLLPTPGSIICSMPNQTMGPEPGCSISSTVIPQADNFYAVADDLAGRVNAGLSLKYINIPGEESKYVSTDLGLQVGDFYLFRLGVLVENFWHLKVGETEAALPTNVVLGAAVRLGEFGTATVDVNDVLNANSARKLMLGVEIKPFRFLTLRAGWDEGWTAGAGFVYRQIKLGYDWAQGQHHLSFGWQF